MARRLLEPNPENASIHDLREAGRVGSSETSTRCTAIQLLVTGVSREQVCSALLVNERSLVRWISAFNEYGVDGLIVEKRPGRNRKIQGDNAKQLVELIDNPQNAERDFWTARAFHGYIRDEYKLDCSYETVVRFFHREGFALKVPQPWPDRQDEEQRAAFLLELKKLHEQPDTELWFADESGFEGDPRPRRRWDRKGKKTRSTKNGQHIRMNVIGMVCPRTGEFFAIEATHVFSGMFQGFLEEAGKEVHRTRKRNVLIMDNASWHKVKSMKWHGFEPMYLPPYSPDFNPIERIWLTMKAKWFNNHVCRNREALIQRLDLAILDVIEKSEEVKKTTSIRHLF